MKSLLVGFSILAMALPQAQAAPSPATAPGVTVSQFGSLKSSSGKGDTPIRLYTLTNNCGVSVSIMNYGATVVNLWTPDRKGQLADIVLGFNKFDSYRTESYLNQGPYFGATVGRYANRIAKGKFTLDGKTYCLPINNTPNSLHGGKVGFDKKVWSAKIVSQQPAAVRFSLVSRNKDQGYPGTLKVWVTYELNDQNKLILYYEAVTDRPTVLNLTNHSYFNLAGAGSGDVLNHKVKIHASRFTPVDAMLIPTGQIQSVAGTPLDFREFTPIGTRIHQVGGNPLGYDHNYVLNKRGFAAEVREPNSGRTLRVSTDQPGLQFYTANFLPADKRKKIQGKEGKSYSQYGAFCLETQHFPDSPNHPNFPYTILRPRWTFLSKTTFKFGVMR